MTQTAAAAATDRITESADTTGLDALFAPRSIAILGASSDPTKIGGRPVRFVQESGFTGAVYPVNPKADTVQGLAAYPDIESVPGTVDLALVALPTAAVLDAVRACGRKGVKVVTIFSAGFAELDDDGAALQTELVAVARSHGMRVLGPNCIGSMNRATGAVGTFAASIGVPFLHDPLATVALASQSGAIASEWVVAGTQRGLQFDPWLSTGNEADIQLADVLAHLALDPTVEVIAAYLEGARDGTRLREALRIAQQAGKPVVALKVGRSDVGATAAASHTASLVGSDQVFDALFDQYGVIRADSMAELFDVCYALAIGRIPVGDRLGILTGSGGVGIIAADEAADQGLRVLAPPAQLQAELKSVWPPAGVGNPIDLTAQIMNDRRLFPTFVDACLSAGSYDSLVLATGYMGLMDPWADQLIEGLTAARAAHPDAPLYVTAMARPEIRQQIEQLGVPVFDDVSTAVRTLARVTDYVLRRQRFERARAAQPAEGGPQKIPELPENLTEVTAKSFIAAAGIGIVPQTVVHTAEDAARAQVDLAEPVVLKVVSPDIAHKTEAGGVELAVATPEEASASYERILASAKDYAPDARVDGVLVSPMVTDGLETILGVTNDPTFGPVVLFGLGGVLVDVLKDVTYRLAPFDLGTAHSMIRDIRAAAVLEGVRGAEPADVEALAQALVTLSRLADAHRDRLDSIDVNPFVVRPAGRGAVALDALVALREESKENPLTAGPTERAPHHSSSPHTGEGP